MYSILKKAIVLMTMKVQVSDGESKESVLEELSINVSKVLKDVSTYILMRYTSITGT